MKILIHANIDEKIPEKVERFSTEAGCSRDKFIQMALEEFLQKRSESAEGIVASNGYFVGNVRSMETYGL